MTHVIYHGHSFIEVETQDGSILIDPFVTGNPQCDISLDELFNKKINAICVTHGHHDHLGDTIEISKKTQCLVITHVELAQYIINHEGYSNCEGLGVGGEKDFGSYKVKLTSALHGGGIDNFESTYTTSATGILIKIGDKTIYHAGDTGLSMEMKLLGDFQKVDVACLPIGNLYTMGIEDAVIATGLIKPKIVFPIHYNTWPKIKADDNEFARLIMMQNIAIPKVLRPGQYLVLE